MAITTEQLAAWRAGDWRDFVETCCILRRDDGTIGPLLASPRQAEWFDALAARKPDGLPRYTTVGIVSPKRSGKTIIGAAAALFVTATGKDRLSIFLSNSRESAESLSFTQVKEFLRCGPFTVSDDVRDKEAQAIVQRGRILFPMLNSELRTVPCVGKVVAGLTVSGLLVSDELWAAGDEEPFDLLMKQRTPMAQALVISQASGLRSRVYELYELARDEAPDHLYHDYIEPEWVDEHRSPNPYLTEEQWASWRAETPLASQWNHYFRNVWAEGSGEYLAPEDLEAAVVKGAALPRSSEECDELLRATVGVGVKECAFSAGIDRGLPNSPGGDDSYMTTTARGQGRVAVVAFDDLGANSKADIRAARDRVERMVGRRVPLTFEVYQSKDIADEMHASTVSAGPQQQAEAFIELARQFAERTISIPEGAAVLLAQLKSFPVDTSQSPPRFGKKVRKVKDDAVYSLVWSLYHLPARLPRMRLRQVWGPRPADDEAELRALEERRALAETRYDPVSEWEFVDD